MIDVAKGVGEINGDTGKFVMQGVYLSLMGAFTTTPYSLITGVVAANLSKHPHLRGSDKAAATVAGLIDGFGSFGAAIQGVVIGFCANENSLDWDLICWILTGLAMCGTLAVSFPMMGEFKERRERRRRTA